MASEFSAIGVIIVPGAIETGALPKESGCGRMPTG